MFDDLNIADLKHILRGRLRRGVSLARYSWFRTGGPADIFFEPADEADLVCFLKQLSNRYPVTVIGVGSNLLVRDGGIEGVVIRLGRGFSDITVSKDLVTAGAGAMDVHVAKEAMKAGLSGLEFLVGVPGSIGGAAVMNAGAYGREVKDVFIQARSVSHSGETIEYTQSDMNFSYRNSSVGDDNIITEVTFRGTFDSVEDIKARMAEITKNRSESQPIGTRTGGSTFKNPDPADSELKAWQLIDTAGCRGLKVGGAEVSVKHCNFLINPGKATASDIETLGELVRKRVLDETGVQLKWEIRRIGRNHREDT